MVGKCGCGLGISGGQPRQGEAGLEQANGVESQAAWWKDGCREGKEVVGVPGSWWVECVFLVSSPSAVGEGILKLLQAGEPQGGPVARILCSVQSRTVRFSN